MLAYLATDHSSLQGLPMAPARLLYPSTMQEEAVAP
jgi:hypothetical protein